MNLLTRGGTKLSGTIGKAKGMKTFESNLPGRKGKRSSDSKAGGAQ